MRTIRWRNRVVYALDQSALPERVTWLRIDSVQKLAQAIERLRIRGAPLIGVAAAYGLVIAAQRSRATTPDALLRDLESAAMVLRATRPTGRNLFWALERSLSVARRVASLEEARRAVLLEANRMAEEDVEANRAMGRLGSSLVEDGDCILTHCDTGLGTVDYGTALGVVRTAWEEGKRIRVYATETRPLLQGARLTAFQLRRMHIPATLITDSAVGYALSEGLVNKVFVGADRMLRTGHVANKIGTLTIAVAAKEFRAPFYVVAPVSTFDPESRPEEVAIEMRDPDEVTHLAGRSIAPAGVPALNPAFDLTPPSCVSAIVTERGILRPPLEESIRAALRGS